MNVIINFKLFSHWLSEVVITFTEGFIKQLDSNRTVIERAPSRLVSAISEAAELACVRPFHTWSTTSVRSAAAAAAAGITRR